MRRAETAATVALRAAMIFVGGQVIDPEQSMTMTSEAAARAAAGPRPRASTLTMACISARPAAAGRYSFWSTRKVMAAPRPSSAPPSPVA
ncbi:hypothetical protein SAZ11_24405 [Streptomyces sp. FXJ1.4098]|nr:hypothetical protein [Streptomyces sp. FXJ1.4098]